ncbi:MAG: ferrous iron transport protein A [Endomicrobium sp.]|jgi:Fe2+ transport system protein FeoA|nr:ferrous iron transport protein A [Endomicrobium sp.]
MLKRFIKHIHSIWHKHHVKRHLKRFNEFNLIFKNNTIIKLSTAVPGVYKFVVSNNTDKKLNLRLLEIGFLPNTKLRVLKNTGKRGSTLVKIKGAKIVLSNKIADKILLKRNLHAWKQKYYSSPCRKSK